MDDPSPGGLKGRARTGWIGRTAEQGSRDLSGRLWVCCVPFPGHRPPALGWNLPTPLGRFEYSSARRTAPRTVLLTSVNCQRTATSGPPRPRLSSLPRRRFHEPGGVFVFPAACRSFPRGDPAFPGGRVACPAAFLISPTAIPSSRVAILNSPPAIFRSRGAISSSRAVIFAISATGGLAGTASSLRRGLSTSASSPCGTRGQASTGLEALRYTGRRTACLAACVHLEDAYPGHEGKIPSGFKEIGC